MGRLGLMAAVLSGALALAAPAFAAPNEWKVVPSPGGVESLSGVSCTTFYSCMAVGDGAESWNGRAWSIVPTAVLPGIGGSHLNRVSCVSDGFCAAVGQQTRSNCSAGPSCTEALSETWNGREWSIVPGAGGAGQFRQDVSCVTLRFCVNVGIRNTATGPEEQRIQSWNGTDWSDVPHPEPKTPCTELCSAPEDEVLTGVSCVSATFCVAVGWVDFAHGYSISSLVESWNGKEWSFVPSPNGAGGSTHLNGVSCVSADRCVAVGHAGNGSLIESWDGKEW